MSTKYQSNFRIFSNNYTTQKLKGKDYLVVPGVIAQEQVMNTYLVPAEELEFAETWNGTPITVRHPQANAGSANVPEPDVAVIGRLFNAEWDDENKRITGEYWIDISEAMQYVEGQYIVNAIYSNQVLETSTGYWASIEYNEGEFKGRPYSTIQHNLKPDHVAILVDEIGACSVADGCGVNRNSLLHSLYTNAVELNGGPGSGYWGHLGRPGQVGGAAPAAKVKAKPRTNKKLKKAVKAYYVSGKSEAENKNSNGFKTRVSLMAKAKAAALFERMTRAEGSAEPAILEVNLKAGTPYESLTATSITVGNVPSSAITMITFETLQKRKQETFTNAADCNCRDAKQVMENEQSITQKVEDIRKAFYAQFEEDMMYSCYIRDYFDNYVIIETKGKLFKATYGMSESGYTFASVEEWTPVAQEYVEVQQNVLGNLPEKAKVLWEKVYQAWLKEHPKDKAGASKRAWGAVKQAGWKKEGDAWVKSNSVVKGVDVKNARVKHTGTLSRWTIKNRTTKEKTMSNRMKDVLDKLRKAGVKLTSNANDEEIDEDTLLNELEDDVEEEETEDEDTTQNARVPQPQFSKQEVEGIRNLLKVDWAAISKLAESAPTMLEVAQNAAAERETRAKQLISGILTNSSNLFTEEELKGLSLPMLTKIHNQYAVDYSGIGGGQPFDFSANAATDEDEVLAIHPIVLDTPKEA